VRGVPELQLGGVQELAWNPLGQLAGPAAGGAGKRALAAGSVRAVAHDGMAYVLQVHPDLVRPAGLEAGA
jgi:hypothetical protein